MRPCPQSDFAAICRGCVGPDLNDDQTLKGLRILAVDDDEANLLLLRRILEREGYTRVDATTDATRVAGLFAERRPDLVLLDLHMPGIDGSEVMERLAPLTADATPVPFMVLTADATDETKRRALALGARDFLTKPLDRVELLLRVRTCSRSSSCRTACATTTRGSRTRCPSGRATSSCRAWRCSNGSRSPPSTATTTRRSTRGGSGGSARSSRARSAAPTGRSS